MARLHRALLALPFALFLAGCVSNVYDEKMMGSHDCQGVWDPTPAAVPDPITDLANRMVMDHSHQTGWARTAFPSEVFESLKQATRELALALDTALEADPPGGTTAPLTPDDIAVRDTAQRVIAALRLDRDAIVIPPPEDTAGWLLRHNQKCALSRASDLLLRLRNALDM